jgi:hypothetical protein
VNELMHSKDVSTLPVPKGPLLERRSVIPVVQQRFPVRPKTC